VYSKTVHLRYEKVFGYMDCRRRVHGSVAARRILSMVKYVWKHVVLFVVMCACATVGISGQGGIDKLAEQGWQALQQGDAARAASAFDAALRRNPRDAVLHLGAGAAAHLLGRDQDAAGSLKRALDLNPKLTPAAELLGQIEYLQGDLETAIRRYELALTSAPEPEATAMRTRLEQWRKEAAVHQTLTERNDGRFSVVFDGRSDNMLAGHAVAVLDRAFWRIGEKIGAYPPNRILVVLYTEQQFRDITRVPAWSNGAFDGKIRIPVQGLSQNMEAFDRVLVHELTHAMVHGIAARGVPAWLHEGLASYFEPRDPAVAKRRLQALNVALPFAVLQAGFSQFTAEQAAVAYEQSVFAVDVLMHLAGPRMAVLLQGMGNGQSFDESMLQLGLSAADFESQVFRRLKP
jgi:peptidase MA superfamily protein/tetratricopeptide repeat protein